MIALSRSATLAGTALGLVAVKACRSATATTIWTARQVWTDSQGSTVTQGPTWVAAATARVY